MRPRYGSAVLLVTLFLAAVPAARADEDPDLFAGLRPGTRVEVHLKSQEVFRGEVKWVIGDRVKIDLTYESKTLEGALTFQRAQIRSITLLQPLSEREKDRILKERDDARARALAEADARRREQEAAAPPAPAGKEKAAPAGEPDEAPPIETRADRARKLAEDLLKRFPTSAGWGPSRYAEIVTKDPRDLDPAEKEFQAHYAEWVAAQKDNARADRRDLLDKYPPEKGWGPEKYAALVQKDTRFKRPDQRDRSNPPLTEEERVFVERFDDWKIAVGEAQQDAADRAAELELQKRKKQAENPDQPPAAQPPATPKEGNQEAPAGTEKK